MARPHDHGPHDPGRPRQAGGLLSVEPDPDALLRQLRAGAGDPPLPPLHLDEPARSARRGIAGVLVSGARGAVLKLISPALGDLLGQLERDRHRTHAEIARLEERVAELERGRES